MRTKHPSAVSMVTAIVLMMAAGAAAQTRAVDRSAGEVAVYDALVAMPQPAKGQLFRVVEVPSPAVASSFRLEFAPARAFQPTATPQRSWADEHPVKFGALIGAGVGAVVGIIAYKTADCPPGRVCSTRGAALTFYPGMGAGLGALLGLVAK